MDDYSRFPWVFFL
jgi:hypothetical protein